ncbi:MAG: hypothetical protein JNM45_00365 [Rhizobiales bacterium]|nr:hypothetical protein [Hyphomicrobiales bacterium]
MTDVPFSEGETFKRETAPLVPVKPSEGPQMSDASIIQARLNELFPRIKAKGDQISVLAHIHILRECHVPRKLIDTRSMLIAASIIRETEEFQAMSELDKDIWAYAIAGFIAAKIRGLQKLERVVH